MKVLGQEYFYGKNKLSIIDKLGPKCVATDFCHLLNSGYNADLEKKETFYWNSTYISKYTGGGFFASGGDKPISFSNKTRFIAIRPALIYSDIKEECLRERTNDGITEVEYGTYPQSVIEKSLSKRLEREYFLKNLEATGKHYTTDASHSFFDSNKNICDGGPFKPYDNLEYEYDNLKVVRKEIIINDAYDGSNEYGEATGKLNYRVVKVYWFKVEPVKWLVDKSGIVLSRNALVSGIELDHSLDKKFFKETSLSKYVSKYLSKEIVQNPRSKNDLNTGKQQDPFYQDTEYLKEMGYSIYKKTRSFYTLEEYEIKKKVKTKRG